MTAKTNAAALSIIGRENRHETETRTLEDKVNHFELLVEEKLNVHEAINRVANGVAGGKSGPIDLSRKPAGESKAIRALTDFFGDR